jgi:hypothetical protein
MIKWIRGVQRSAHSWYCSRVREIAQYWCNDLALTFSRLLQILSPKSIISDKIIPLKLKSRYYRNLNSSAPGESNIRPGLNDLPDVYPRKLCKAADAGDCRWTTEFFVMNRRIRRKNSSKSTEYTALFQRRRWSAIADLLSKTNFSIA